MSCGQANHTLATARAGIDGNWSTFQFFLGDPGQYVQVLASTALSEFWAVGEGGCRPREPHCTTARGGIFRPEQSSGWSDMGIWSLGLEYLGYGGNGDYGLDLLEFQGAQSGADFSMESTLIADFNSTDYFLGYFGLGLTQANFDGVVAKSPLTQAVETYGLVPSYTYGYTAGAHYRNTPASLTLGGFDLARLENHDNQFSLGSDDNYPWALVRGIQVNTKSKPEFVAEYDSNDRELMNYTASFTAQIDSTTPFLWLPSGVCDAFASALNLTYDESFGLYLLTDEQYESFRTADEFNFTFSLSSFDNTDNFGDPLDVPGVVNITISSRALVGTLKYPYMDEAIGYGDPALPYFGLRKSSENLIIGRSFLQETYLFTEYDKRIFSIHQARFPEDPAADMEIFAVEQPSNSPYPPPKPASGRSLSPSALGGIIGGSIVGAILAVVAFWLCRRKRKAKKSQASASDSELEKKCPSTAETPAKGSPVTRFVNRIVQGFDRKKSSAKKQGAPTEVPNHEIFELPCAIEPAELTGDGNDADNEVEYGYDTRNLSAYEQARLKIDRQLAGPVPEYSPPASGNMPGPEKEPTRTQRTDSPQYAPVSPPAPDSNYSNSLHGSALSPISPHAPSSGSYSFPRAATVGPHSTRSTWGRSTRTDRTQQSSSTPPISPSHIALPPSPRFQRTPIDPSNVVYLGILPDQEHQTSRPPTPEILHPDGRPVIQGDTLDPDAGSFNSSFAGEDEVRWHLHQQEEAHIAALAAMHGAHPEMQAHDAGASTMDSHRRWSLQTEHYERSHDTPPGTTNLGSHDGREYLDLAAGMEFVHVPQLPHRRYSWEEEE